MDANLILKGPLAKIRHAYSHIDGLRRLTDPLAPEFYTLGVESRSLIPYAGRTEYSLAYRPTRDIPEALSLIIGDSLNNLRSALDYLASGIVRAKSPNAQVHFPIRLRREDLVNSTDLAAMEKALPGSKELLLAKIRPENGPNEAAWAFASLNNEDKHNVLVPTVAAVRVLGTIRSRTGSNTLNFENCEFNGDAAHELKVLTSYAPISAEKNVHVIVDVLFGRGNPFENEPVIPTLLQVARVVSETLDGFENLIRTSPS